MNLDCATAAQGTVKNVLEAVQLIRLDQLVQNDHASGLSVVDLFVSRLPAIMP